MKLRLTIAFLGVVAALNAQTLKDIEKRLSFLHNSIPLPYDTTGFFKVPKVKYFCSDRSSTSEFLGNKRALDYHHVADLNNDGLNDLIYSGPCQPYYQTGIFLNDGEALKLIHDYPGEVVSLVRETEKTVINILEKACCCNRYSNYLQVTVWDDSRVEKNWIAFEGNTEIEVAKVSEIQIKGILRTSPEINDQKRPDNCSDQIFEGNHLAHINKLTTVVQLSQAGQWRLVLYHVDKHKSYIGWIN